VEPAPLTRLLRWIDSPEARALDVRMSSAVREAATAPTSVTSAPAGTVSCFVTVAGLPRRAIDVDRHGALVTGLRWRDDGELDEAAVRLPDRSWIVIEPGASPNEPWGASDRVWHASGPGLAGARPLTVFTALRWSHVDEIPTVAEPARLPAGAGTAVLNLLAALAADQGRRALVYRGPFPSEHLFLALLESFRYAPEVNEPLRAFLAGEVEWTPAPHERMFERGGVYVQLRGRVEKVVWRGRAYCRRDWQSVARHAPRRIHDAFGVVRCSLWALGEPLEDHLDLAVDGRVMMERSPSPASDEVRLMPAPVAEGATAAVAAASAPALGPAIRGIGRRLAFEWGPVDHDLVAFDDERVRVSTRLRDAASRRSRAAADQRARMAVAVALLAEMTALVGDSLRARAQAEVSALAPEAQAALLEARNDRPPDVTVELRDAAMALCAELTGG
jgi:hypothetical protein